MVDGQKGRKREPGVALSAAADRMRGEPPTGWERETYEERSDAMRTFGGTMIVLMAVTLLSLSPQASGTICTYRTLDYPGAWSTAGMAISGGNVVGYYYDGTQIHGFLWDDSSYTTLDPSGPCALSSSPLHPGPLSRVSRGRGDHGRAPLPFWSALPISGPPRQCRPKIFPEKILPRRIFTQVLHLQGLPSSVVLKNRAIRCSFPATFSVSLTVACHPPHGGAECVRLFGRGLDCRHRRHAQAG